jgi:hypothetical protein
MHDECPHFQTFRGPFLSALLASGCAHYPVNAPLAAVDARSGYRFQNPSSPTRYWSAPKADNCGGELVNQTAFL